MQRDIQKEALHHKFTLRAGMRQDERQEVSNVRQRPKELNHHLLLPVEGSRDWKQSCDTGCMHPTW